MSSNTTSAKILKITIDADINIIKVGITSSCTGEAVSQPEDSGCFRKSDGDPDENLKIQASNAKVMNRNWSSISSEQFVIKTDWQQDQVNNADSAIIFLINHLSVRIVKVVWSARVVEVVQDV